MCAISDVFVLRYFILSWITYFFKLSVFQMIDHLKHNYMHTKIFDFQKKGKSCMYQQYQNHKMCLHQWCFNFKTNNYTLSSMLSHGSNDTFCCHVSCYMLRFLIYFAPPMLINYIFCFHMFMVIFDHVCSTFILSLKNWLTFNLSFQHHML